MVKLVLQGDNRLRLMLLLNEAQWFVFLGSSLQGRTLIRPAMLLYWGRYITIGELVDLAGRGAAQNR